MAADGQTILPPFAQCLQASAWLRPGHGPSALGVVDRVRQAESRKHFFHDRHDRAVGDLVEGEIGLFQGNSPQGSLKKKVGLIGSLWSTTAAFIVACALLKSPLLPA